MGRLAGPWVAELEHAWKDVASRLDEKKLSLDVRDLTYSDAGGKRVLRDMFVKNSAEFVTSNDWSNHFAEEIKNINQCRNLECSKPKRFRKIIGRYFKYE